MAYQILSRSHWTSTAASGTPINWDRVRGIVAHYPAMGGDVGVLSPDEEEYLIRSWRNFHTRVLGWRDLGYNFVIGQSGRIYNGRGERVGAHSVGHNSTTLGVLFIVGDNEPLTKAAKRAFRALRARLRKKGAGSGVWGHREMSGNSTRCPGPHIMADIRSGALTGASAPSPPSTPGLSDGLAHVDDSQRWLAALGYEPGPVDGIFGSRTESATRQAQLDLGITPADGRPGPATRKELELMANKIDTLLAEVRAIPARVLDEPIALAGMHEGVTSTARTKLAWQGHNFTQTHQAVAAAQAAIIKAVQETGRAQGLTDEQVRVIVDKATEAAATVRAEDVAERLDVTVSKPQG